MINPLEAVIQLAARDADLNAEIAGRVAARHKYGEGWARGAQALRIGIEGGVPELDVRWQRLRLACWCYGGSPAQAMRTYLALADLCRRVERDVVDTGRGFALVYWLNAVSGPSLLRDPEIDMDAVLVYVEAAVGERPASPGTW